MVKLRCWRDGRTVIGRTVDGSKSRIKGGASQGRIIWEEEALVGHFLLQERILCGLFEDVFSPKVLYIL